MTTTHTPGPWRWELNRTTKSLCLVGGIPKFDLTIFQPTRWGMNNATLILRDTAEDGLNVMHKLHERPDWIEPFEGRQHHAKWCANVIHPDMRLIAAAPELLAALQNAVDYLSQSAFEEWLNSKNPSGDVSDVQMQWESSSDFEDIENFLSIHRAAIAKATGAAA